MKWTAKCCMKIVELKYWKGESSEMNNIWWCKKLLEAFYSKFSSHNFLESVWNSPTKKSNDTLENQRSRKIWLSLGVRQAHVGIFQYGQIWAENQKIRKSLASFQVPRICGTEFWDLYLTSHLSESSSNCSWWTKKNVLVPLFYVNLCIRCNRYFIRLLAHSIPASFDIVNC